MIVWGGCQDGNCAPILDGGRYDPAGDTWTPTSSTNAPSARRFHTAIWTGSRMVVWGGYNVGLRLDTGGQYDPATDAWTTISITNAPSARFYHTAVWTGSFMVVWGGKDGSPFTNTGGRYDPASN